jgi:hypothetical protein
LALSILFFISGGNSSFVVYRWRKGKLQKTDGEAGDEYLETIMYKVFLYIK